MFLAFLPEVFFCSGHYFWFLASFGLVILVCFFDVCFDRCWNMLSFFVLLLPKTGSIPRKSNVLCGFLYWEIRGCLSIFLGELFLVWIWPVDGV